MLLYFICPPGYWNGLIAIKITSRVEITLHSTADALYCRNSSVPAPETGLYKVPALAFLSF